MDPFTLKAKLHILWHCSKLKAYDNKKKKYTYHFCGMCLKAKAWSYHVFYFATLTSFVICSITYFFLTLMEFDNVVGVNITYFERIKEKNCSILTFLVFILNFFPSILIWVSFCSQGGSFRVNSIFLRPCMFGVDMDHLERMWPAHFQEFGELREPNSWGVWYILVSLVACVGVHFFYFYR